MPDLGLTKDERLTDDQQFAVIGHCMRSPDWFLRISPTLPAQYFMNLKARTIYGYVLKMYEHTRKPISTAELKAIVRQEQSDPATVQIYCNHIDDAMMKSVDFNQARLTQALQKQRLSYEYQSGMVELSKHVGAGKRDKAMETVAKLAELNKIEITTQPTTEENLVALTEEEAKWEANLRNRVPLITATLSGSFMLIPGITLIGGVTKAGKSTFLANLVPAILDHFQQKKIYIITNEDNLDLVATRVACCAMGVDVRTFRFKPDQLPADLVVRVKEMKRAVASRIVVASMPHFDTSNMETVQDLLLEAKQKAIAGEYSAILLDYYQIVANSTRFQNIEYVGIMKKFGTWLKGYGADLGIPLVVFAQLKPHSDKQDVPFQQRVQADQTIANHVHVGLEIVKDTDDLGYLTKVICHLSRHGDILGTIATFRYDGGLLRFQPKG